MSRRRSFLNALPHAYVASLIVAIAAFGGGGEQKSESAQIVACEGDGCWECGPITIKSVTRTVCEKPASGAAVPESYDCTSGSDSVLCPPIGHVKGPDLRPIPDSTHPLLSSARPPPLGCVGFFQLLRSHNIHPWRSSGPPRLPGCVGVEPRVTVGLKRLRP